MDFEPFKFEPRYSAELEPEMPARGWGCPTYTFDEEGVRTGLDAVGPSSIVEFSFASSAWVGRFMSWGGNTLRVLASPNTTSCVVVSGTLAYLVDVATPESGAPVVMPDVQSADALTEPPLLVLASWTHLVAIGAAGLAWKTPRLAIDDLTIRSITQQGIECDCDSPGVGGLRRIAIDPRDGSQIGGSRLPDPFL